MRRQVGDAFSLKLNDLKDVRDLAAEITEVCLGQQGYLAQKKRSFPWDHHRALGMCLL